MKVWALGAAVTTVAIASLQTPPKPTEYVFFLGGDAQGYLSPCGCSSPMIGGTKRRATAIEKLGVKGRTLLLENGGLVKQVGRQDEIKLETFAQMHAAAHGAGMNLSPSEAAMGPGAILSMTRLSGNRLLTASIKPMPELPLPAFRTEGPFLISGVTSRPDALAASLGAEPIPLEIAVSGLVGKAKAAKKSLVLILDGSREEAMKLAQRHPGIALIQYRAAGSPPDRLQKVGSVALASPGDAGRSLIRLVWKDGRFNSYVPIQLDPSYKDEPKASSAYKTYLSRIASEDLLKGVSRPEKGKYVGSATCASCHAAADKVWKSSKHAHALHTLEKEGHDRDPDCVECHVVGLASINGFLSRRETPNLADVGCESCHGAGADHSANPKLKMGKVGENACMPCHRVDNSPKFDFKTYWDKIKH